MPTRQHSYVAILVLAALVFAAPAPSYAGGFDFSSRMVHPNPFTEGTTFQLTMPKSGRIRISVYDMAGRLIRTLFDGVHPEGEYPVPWDGKDEEGHAVVAGVYICVLFSDNVAVKSVKVIKAQT